MQHIKQQKIVSYKLIISIFWVLIFTSITIANENTNQIIITEIFFDANGSDNNNEFVEFTFEGKMNISQFNISDDYSSDKLQILQNSNSSTYLIVEDGFDYSNLNCTIISAGTTIGNNLNNDFDKITIFNKTTNRTAEYNVLNFQYFAPGLSISLDNNSKFKTSYPTPCKNNIFWGKTHNNSENNTNRTESDHTNSTSQTNNQTECNSSFNIESNSFFNDEKIVFTFKTDKKIQNNFSIEYWITDSKGNVVKEPWTTNNFNEKQFSPRTDEHDIIYTISAILNIETCNSSKFTEKVIAYINSKGATNNEIKTTLEKKINECESSNKDLEKKISSKNQNDCLPPTQKIDTIENGIKILHIYDINNIEFGGNLKFKIMASNKDSENEISTKIIDENNKTLFLENNLEFFKNSKATFSQEINVPNKCITSENLTLVIYGFGKNDSFEFFAKCKQTFENQSKKISSEINLYRNKLTLQDQNLTKVNPQKNIITADAIINRMVLQEKETIADTMNTKNIYESTESQTKKAIPILTTLIFTSICIAFIFKKKG